MSESVAPLVLPIMAHLDSITDAMKMSRIVVLTAPTGTGKSTTLPDHLEGMISELQQHQNKTVVVAVPRRLLAWSIATRVASLRGESVGESVGFHTGHEKCYSKNTRLFFVTDGLEEIRELLGHTWRRAILIIDELHEWNIRQEILLCLARDAVRQKKLSHLLVMSATIRTEKLSAYLDSAPVINIPGEMYPVTEAAPYKGNIVDLIEAKIKEGKNTLVFVPGKREIRGIMAKLDSTLNAVILPLHGELTTAEQQRCFEKYDKPLCVISTDIAQSGVTVPNIDVVIDTGKVRIWKAIDGIEGLYTAFISIDDYLQRRGRTGRTGPGEYIPCYDPSSLAKHPTPEIERLLLETTILRIKAFSGKNLEELDLFHKPKPSEIRGAKLRLRALGCLNENGHVTQLGREVAMLPISPQLGVMLLEARQYGVLEDAISIAAIVEAKGIVESDNMTWHSTYCPKEKDSDVLAQLAVFKGARKELDGATNPELRNTVEAKLRSLGINLLALGRAIEKRAKIAESIRPTGFECPATLYRNNLLTAIRRGFSGHFFIQTDHGWMNSDGDIRKLAGSSILPRDAKIVVGLPWNLDISESEPGEETLLLIRMGTVVHKADVPHWLLQWHQNRRKQEHQENSRSGKPRGNRNRRKKKKDGYYRRGN